MVLPRSSGFFPLVALRADDEPEPKLEKRDRDAAISILKMMSRVWKLAPGLAKRSEKMGSD